MGLSQNAFGKLLSTKKPIPKATISAWECDRNEPSGITVVAMEEKTGYSARWILTGAGPEDAATRYLQSFEQHQAVRSQLEALDKDEIKKIINKYIQLI